MGIITKGMGAILKGSKKVAKRVKEDAPFYGIVAGVDVGKRAYNKLIKAKDPHEGTLSGVAVMIAKDIKKIIKNKKKKKKDK